jgi:hypothetical protein
LTRLNRLAVSGTTPAQQRDHEIRLWLISEEIKPTAPRTHEMPWKKTAIQRRAWMRTDITAIDHQVD